MTTIKEARKRLLLAVENLNHYYEGDGLTEEKCFFGQGSAIKTQKFIDKCCRKGIDVDELLESIIRNDWMVISKFRHPLMSDIDCFVFKNSVVYVKMAFKTTGELVVDIHD